MAIQIMTNVASLGAQRRLGQTQEALSANVQRLSSGLRINRASDDAAGLAISSRMGAHIRGLAQAERNANDAISMVQVAEGALGQMNGLLTRMRELAVQGSNEGTLGVDERGALDDEYQALEAEVDRISNVTEYNGAKLLDGTLAAGVNFQVGIFDTADDRITVSAFGDIDSAVLGTDATDITTALGAQASLTVLDGAINQVSSRRGDLGSSQNRLSVTIANLGTAHENLSAANSRIMDVDVAHETAEMTKNNILMQAGVSVLAQANQMPSVALSLIG